MGEKRWIHAFNKGVRVRAKWNASSSIWTGLTESIFRDDNRYATLYATV